MPNFGLKLILTRITTSLLPIYSILEAMAPNKTDLHIEELQKKFLMLYMMSWYSVAWRCDILIFFQLPSQLQLQKFRNLAWPQILLELIRAWNPSHSKGRLSIWGRRSSIRWRANSKITSISLYWIFFIFSAFFFLGIKSAYFVVILSMTEIGLSGFVCSLSIYLFRICSLE